MWSGVERYSLDLCRHFRDAGCDVMVVSRDARAVDDMFRHHSIPVSFAPLGGFFCYDAMKALSRILASDHRPAVVHCHDTRDAFVALMARKLSGSQDVRIVLTRHYVRRAGRSPLHRYVYNNVDSMIFVSRLSRKVFFSGFVKNALFLHDDKRFHTVHNSLNIHPAEVAPEPEKGPVTAIYLGRLAPDKGLEYIIDALALLKDTKLRLRIVGTGHPDYVDSLRHKAMTTGVMQMIDWPRHKEEASEFIRASHFAISPSVAPEAFGLSNIECMAEGRAVITSDNGAQREYITNGTDGILVPPRDAKALSAEMRRLATDSKLRHRLGMMARRRFESSLSWPHFAARMKAIYDI